MRLSIVIAGVLCFFHCSGEDLQEAISGCQIEEGMGRLHRSGGKLQGGVLAMGRP